MSVNISIDPGTNHLGVCVWSNGKPIEVFTLHSPSELPFVGKYMWLKSKLSGHLIRLVDAHGGIQSVAVEDFEGYSAKLTRYAMSQKDKMVGIIEKSKKDMIKCAKIAGMCLCLGDDFAQKSFEQSKKSIKKEETAMLAKSWGIKGSRDALDSLQIGICAGFDRPQRGKR